MKNKLYFNEYNVRMGGFSYLPLVSGLLRSYAETFPEIREGYEFMTFIYAMDVPSRILEQYTEPPAVACFSSMIQPNGKEIRVAAMEFDHNLPEYFDMRFSTRPVPLTRKPTWMTLQPEDYRGDLKEFARMSILWGRKSGTMLVKHAYGFR